MDEQYIYTSINCWNDKALEGLKEKTSFASKLHKVICYYYKVFYKKKVEEGWIFKNLLKVQLEAMQRELQENPHDEANKATLNKALEELQAIEKKKIYDLLFEV